MKKRLSFLVVALLSVLYASAQMIAYSVTSHVQGEPGTPTVIDLQGVTGTDLKGYMIDADGNMEFNSVEDAKCFPIGFDFAYNGQQMKYFLIGTDGEIQLSTTETCSTNLHKNASNFFTNNGCHDAFGIVMRQGFFGLDDTEISFWNEGVAGTRTLCIQYKNVDFQTSFGVSADNCGAKATILYRLYEKSGNIEMKLNGFKPESTGNYNFMRIGLLGDSQDFIQIQHYDGSVLSARDNSISYDVNSYPQDGTVYTFVAPEPCQQPTVAPSNLTLTSTTKQISGTFTPGSADHYLVLATTDAELTQQPADQTKYKVGDQLGNATVIAIVALTDAQPLSFQSPNNMAQGNYQVFVIGFNSLCSGGPDYAPEAATAAIPMKPVAPEAITLSNIEKTSVQVSVTPNGTTPVILAMTTEQEVNFANQYLPNGLFGIPTGNYQVGDQIEGGGKVIFIGTPEEALTIGDLSVGSPIFFRAWSSDGQGGYSSEYVDAANVTAAEVPWQLVIDDKLVVGDDYLGWTSDNGTDAIWSDNTHATTPYIYNQVSRFDETEGTISWYETPYIYLAPGANRIKTAIGGTKRAGWMQGDWELADGEKIVFQVTKDGTDYKDILTIDNSTLPQTKNADFTPFQANFSDFAGEKVRLRIYIHRFSMGQTQFSKLIVEQKPEVDEPVNVEATDIVGGNVTVQWTPQGTETKWQVSYKQAEADEWGEPIEVAEPKITLTDLIGLTKYELRVRALTDDNKQSNWTEPIIFTTGISVPFEFTLSGATSMDGWSTYQGVLGETTTLEEGGDINIATAGWGAATYNTRFAPYDSETHSWLVTPKLGLGNNAKDYIAKLALSTIFEGSESQITVKVVVARDGENFSSNDVIGTITNDQLPTNDEENKEYSFPVSGFTGDVRLGIYFEGEGSDMSWFIIDKVGLTIDEVTTDISTVRRPSAGQTTYNLSGQRMAQPNKGLIIVNGKKTLKK